MKLLVIWIIVLIVQGLWIDPNLKLQIENRISLQGLRDIKSSLESELRSLISPLSFEKSNDTQSDDLIILSSNVLNGEIFDKLGLGFLNENGFTFNFNNENIRIPKDFKNLFIFNTSNPLSIPKSKHHNFANFVDQSLPFNLPNHMNLKNYYLVIPKVYLQSKLESMDVFNSTSVFSKSVFSKSVLSEKISQMPIFRSIISENKPLMVFMFSDSNLKNFEFFKNPIMNIKNYLKTEKDLISTFFDRFAQNWIKTVNYDSLVQSVFCTTNPSSLDNSYCLQVHDARALYLFPAFFDISRLMTFDHYKNDKLESPAPYKNDTSTKRSDVETQAIRQIHDKVSNLADKFNDVTYELATEPKPLIERMDERFDDKVYKFYDKFDEKKDNIQDKKDKIKESFVDKIDTLKSKLGKSNSGYQLDNSLTRRNFDEEEESLLPFQPEGGLILPLSLIRVAEHTLDSPRHKSYSQVITEPARHLTKRFSIFSKDIHDCEKITWFNVFHHSIFGKPKFCLED